MLHSVFSGASALKTFTKGMEVVGNNVANVNSLGFKGQRPEYTDGFTKPFYKQIVLPQTEHPVSTLVLVPN